jgi:pyruvate/2-oxoglutarate dehydrogenase complex dihydrolipoamide acyltransferase (E2) component
MDLKPVVVGPPGYGSPDPSTQEGRLVPLDQHPRKDDISDDYAADLEDHVVSVDASGSANVVDDPSGSEEEENATDGAVELALEEDVDLSEVKGTGDGGRVTKADVQKFVDDRDNA